MNHVHVEDPLAAEESALSNFTDMTDYLAACTSGRTTATTNGRTFILGDRPLFSNKIFKVKHRFSRLVR
jgi:hypothetical protein